MMGFSEALSVPFLIVHGDARTTIFSVGDDRLGTPLDRRTNGNTFDNGAFDIIIQLGFHCVLLVMWYRDRGVHGMVYCIRFQVYMSWFMI